MRYYSRTTGCTYLKNINGDNIPVDAIEISEDTFRVVLASPAPGKVVDHDINGLPFLIDRIATEEQRGEDARFWRGWAIESVKWLRERHRDEIESGLATSLSAEKFSDLLAYVQSLRDWPAAAGFPDKNSQPLTPDWLIDLLPVYVSEYQI